MTGRQFMKWLRDKEELDFYTREGAFVSMEIVNTKTGEWAYFSGPFDDREVPDADVLGVCAAIQCGVPPGL